MKLVKATVEFYIPDNTPIKEALSRTTHMAIAAHHDYIEIMAYDGILKGFNNNENFFFGVVVTNGSGSAREGKYKDYTDAEMIEIRKKEQRKAAMYGDFGALALLDYPSKEIKDPNNQQNITEIKSLIEASKPNILYTHNLADKHDTHIGVTTKVIKALRMLDPSDRPEKVYGCEVWRDLDWMLDDEKVAFDVSERPNIAAGLVEIFDSQIIGGKRYDKAAIGRRLAHATFSTSHQVDQTDALIYAMDLTPLMLDETLDIAEYVTAYIERFKQDVSNKINKML